MFDIRPPLPSRRRVEAKRFVRIKHMKSLNTKKTTVGDHLIENSEDVYDMPDEDKNTSVVMDTDDCIDDYLQPIHNQAEAESRKERIRRWNLDRTAKQQLLTVGGPCSSKRLKTGENTQVVNETRKQGSDYGALTIGSILVLIILAACLCVFLSSTTATTSTSPDSVTPKSESKCTSIILEEVNNIKQKVERLELRIKDLTNQFLNKTDMVKFLSDKIDLLELYMKNNCPVT